MNNSYLNPVILGLLVGHIMASAIQTQQLNEKLDAIGTTQAQIMEAQGLCRWEDGAIAPCYTGPLPKMEEGQTQTCTYSDGVNCNPL